MHRTIRMALPDGNLDIEALLAFHRSVFGCARMEGDDDAAADGDDTDAGDSADGDDDAADGDDDDAGKDKLGDAGKKALDRMKEQRNAERERRKALEQELAKARAGARKDDGEPTADEIREQARQEARTEVLRDRVADKIEAKAGTRFSVKPERIAAMLLREHDVDDFIDDGKIDAEAIAEALDKLLEEEPHLAAQGGKRFKGTADGGTRKETPAKPTSLHEAVQARLSRSG